MELERGTATFDGGVFEGNSSGGPLIYVAQATASFDHVVFRSNGLGGVVPTGLLYVHALAIADVENTLAHDNALNGFAPLFKLESAGSRFVNNTAWNNALFGESVIYAADGVVVENNVLNANVGAGVDGTALAVVAYNNVFGNTAAYRAGVVPTFDIVGDPLLTDPANGDFTLSAGSVAIDAGDPAAAYADADGSVNDAGAFGGPGGVWSP